MMAATLILAACEREATPDVPYGPGIVFSVTGAECLTVEEEPVTKGTLVNDASPSFSFGVSEFNGSAAVSSFQNVQPVYESNISSGNELFNSQQRWETPAYTGTAYSFHAYSPYLSSTSNGLTLLSGNKTISYSLSGLSPAAQPDLMTAYAESDYVAAVPLTFQHRLAAVGITLSASWGSGYTVTGISFSNIVTGGSLTISAGKDAAWNSYGSRAAYTVPSGYNTSSSTSATVIAGAPSTYLMMVPQTLSGNAVTLTVTLTKSGQTYTVALPLSGSWKAGETYIYTIDPPLQFSSMTAVYPKWDDGGSGTYGPVSAYDTGSNIFGMYAVDQNGTAVFSNVPVGVSSVSGQTATLSLPSDRTYSASYRYFLYYPYKSSLSGSVTTSATDAGTFFSGVISSWTPATTQNTAALYKAQDLQVGMMVNGTFTMAHTMGLAKVTRANKSIATTRTYTYGANTSYSDSGTTSQAAPDFSSTTRFYSSSGNWTIVKATGTETNEALSLTSATGTHGDKWSLTISNVGRGKHKAYTVTTSLEYLNYVGLFPFTGSLQTVAIPFAGTYKLEVWGAQGCSATVGSFSVTGGYGAYAVGNISLTAGQTLYVMVGGRGRIGLNDGGRYTSFPNGGPGGAPNLAAYSGSGGGSTHIATNSALPKSLSASQILIMAGGGGAAAIHVSNGSLSWGGNGGSGGGVQGNSGTNVQASFFNGAGGTQEVGGVGGWKAEDTNYKGSKGQGGGNYTNDCTGGGGGYYGGGASWGSGGGGGSGYIGNSSLTNKQMVGYNVTANSTAATKTVSTTNVSGTPTANYAKSGDGYAKITSQ